MNNSPRVASIHILDDDSLLHVFCQCRPFILGEDEDESTRLYGGGRIWIGGRWWYRPAHVCQRWRNLILESASYLGISLVCVEGTPVADMLAHSPPLPLFIDYSKENKDTTENEEDAILALMQRDRIRRVRLVTPVSSLPKLIAAMDEEYPVLEYLIIGTPFEDKRTILILPEALQAPNLRHLTLIGFTLPIGSRLLTTAVGLVTLHLVMNDQSAYFRLNALLHWLSFMPQLETLAISFYSAVPNRDIERQLTITPIITPVTLPNLHHFSFRGVSASLEALVHWITAPRLEELDIIFSNQFTFSIPRFVQFSNALENLRFDSVRFWFYNERVYLQVYLRGEIEMNALIINVVCCHLDWQVSAVAQISNSFSQLFFEVEHLAFVHETHSRSSEEHNVVDRTEWRKLLRPFSNVKILQIGDGLVEQLSRCLELEDGELPLDLLPKLQELVYPGSDNTDDTFASFVNARQNADLPVPDQDYPALLSHAQIFPAITPGSNEAGSNLDP
jgi:hypothetical protein